MKLTSSVLVILSLLTAGCTSTRYADPTAIETINAQYGSTDLQTFAREMVAELNAVAGLNFLNKEDRGGDPRIVLYFDSIYNETREHINMGLLRDKMIAELVTTGRFRIVAGKLGQDELGEQLRFQTGSGLVDPDQAKQAGRQVGADVVIYGAMRDITKKSGRSLESGGTRTKDVYYNLFLRMDSIETAETLWAKDKEIRKRQITGLFG